MPFPTTPTAVASTLLQSNQPTATTTHTFPNLSNLPNTPGALLLAIIVTYLGGSTNAEFSAWGGSFTEFIDQAANSATIQAIGAAYKLNATGSESGTFTVTTVGSTRSVMFLMEIPGAHLTTPPEATAKANGTSAAADPVALDPAGWAAEDTLWIAVGVNGETSLTGSFTGITAAPANYTGYLDSGIIGGDVIGALEGAVAFRQLNTGSENVGVWTLDVGAAGNSALLIAIRPIPPIVLVPANAAQAQTSDSPTLVQHHVLVVQNATHAQVAGGGGTVVYESVAATRADGASPTVAATALDCDVGDVLIFFHGNDFYETAQMPEPTVTGSPDVTLIPNSTADAGTNGAHVKAYWAEVNSSGSNVVSVTEDSPAGDEEKSMVVYRLSGADAASPIVDADNSENASSSASHVGPAVDGLAGGLLIVHDNAGGGNQTASYSFPGSMTERYDSSDGTFYSHAGATEALTADGSTGTRTVTPAGSVPFGLSIVSVRPSNTLTLTVHESFAAFDATQAMTSDSPVLTQHHVLVVNNASQAQSSGSPTLVEHQTLAVNNASQGQTSDSPTLVQHHVLTIASATQAQTSGSPSLTQHHVLAVNNANQAQTSGNVTLTQHHVLSVASANQAQTSTSPTLTQHHILVVNNSAQSQTADNVVVTPNEGFDVNDALQGQFVDNVVLTQHHVLVVDNTVQTQTVDDVALAQTHVLTVSDVNQTQTSDNLDITQSHILLVADATHTQTSSSPELHEANPSSIAREAAFMMFF